MSMLYKKQTKIKTNMIKWKTRYKNYNELAKNIIIKWHKCRLLGYEQKVFLHQFRCY